jgi:prepilin-type N-terminal cleavage/methylation domain-containing protein
MNRDQAQGFTLIELLISMTLISVLVLILSMAVRSGLRAWVRGKEINERLIAMSAVEGLMGRQLRATVKDDGSEIGQYVDFNGSDEEISFVTTYIPRGFQAGGVFRVVYRFDEREKLLVYAQRVITREQDLEETLEDGVETKDHEDLAEEGWDISVVSGIESLAFTFTDTPDDTDPEEWKNDWDQRRRIPAAVGIGWMWLDTRGEPHEEPSKSWIVLYTDPLIPVGVGGR